MEKRKVIIIDIDGTIANIDHRKYLLIGPKRDRDAFYQACVYDTPIQENIDLIRKDLEENSADPVFITGRSDLVKEETVKWLFDNFLPASAETVPLRLYMRKHGDHREDYEVKKEVCAALSESCEFLCAYEDRPQVIRMYEEIGIPVNDVGPGIEF